MRRECRSETDRPLRVARSLSMAVAIALATVMFAMLPLTAAQARSWVGDIPGTGPDYTIYSLYDAGQSGRGNYTVMAKNTGSAPWGAFHFKIFDPTGGLDITSVSFLDAAAGGEDPTSSQSSLQWEIDNQAVGAKIDLFFCSDPVEVGETAWFSVYISNPDHVSFFGVAFYPGPVPPAGACCMPDGSCTMTCELDCVAPGFWHGESTLCDPNPCPQPPPKGACCDPESGDCVLLTQAECLSSDWIPDATCGPDNPCALQPPVAACCDLEGHCTLSVESECRLPSVWHPEWSSCNVIVCPRPVPAQPATWGSIKATYR